MSQTVWLVGGWAGTSPSRQRGWPTGCGCGRQFPRTFLEVSCGLLGGPQAAPWGQAARHRACCHWHPPMPPPSHRVAPKGCPLTPPTLWGPWVPPAAPHLVQTNAHWPWPPPARVSIHGACNQEWSVWGLGLVIQASKLIFLDSSRKNACGKVCSDFPHL